MHEATVCHLLRGVGGQTQVLLGKRQSLFWNGIWNGPGGKMEPGETIAKCVFREVREEVGVRISKPSLVHFATVDCYYPSPSGFYLGWKVHHLRATQWKGEPKPAEGFSELRWFNINDLPYSMMMADQRVWMPTAIADQLRRLIIAEVFYGDADSKTVEKSSLAFVNQPAKPARRRRK